MGNEVGKFTIEELSQSVMSVHSNGSEIRSPAICMVPSTARGSASPSEFRTDSKPVSSL